MSKTRWTLLTLSGIIFVVSVNQYEQLQEQFNFQDQQYGSVNCYHSPLYYNNPLYFDPLSYEVE